MKCKFLHSLRVLLARCAATCPKNIGAFISLNVTFKYISFITLKQLNDNSNLVRIYYVGYFEQLKSNYSYRNKFLQVPSLIFSLFFLYLFLLYNVFAFAFVFLFVAGERWEMPIFIFVAFFL